MEISENISLKPYNTFGVDVKARRFLSVSSNEELKQVLRKHYGSELFILGGGSNMLLTRDIEKTVVRIGMLGKNILSQNGETVVIRAMAGENWHQLVLWTLENGFGGLENLSLIPGNVGTAPIQNIGAYGVELKDVFLSCQAINVQTLEDKTFDRENCAFGYRDSVFKNQLKGKFIITSIDLRLSKTDHKLQTGYGAINTWLEQHQVNQPGIRDVSDAVIAIRQAKLPDPRRLGNSGSFFKNPVVPRQELKRLQTQFPEIPFYPLDKDQVKIPAGWLIDQAGLKGYRKGNAGVHQHQALVLVNFGEATGEEILELAREVQERIHRKFSIALEPEVNII